MLQKVEILDSGETTLIRGDTVELAEAVLENQKVEMRGGRIATARPVLLDITKALLQTRSLISAASFRRPPASSLTPRGPEGLTVAAHETL